MDRTAWTLRAFNRKRARFGADLCSLVTRSSTPDGFGGTSDAPTTIASDLRCFIEAFKSPMQVTVGGAQLTSLTHKVTIEATALSKAIRPDYEIVVAARNDKGELIFRQPVTLDGSYTPLVEVAAVLAEQGEILAPVLLLESGFALLLESGDQLLLDAA